MKKILTLMLGLVIAAVLVGCGGGSDGGSSSKDMPEIMDKTKISYVDENGNVQTTTLRVYDTDKYGYTAILDSYTKKIEDTEQAYIQNLSTNDIFFAEVAYDSTDKIFHIVSDLDSVAYACPGSVSKFKGMSFSEKTKYGDVEEIVTTIAKETVEMTLDGGVYKTYPITYTYIFPYAEYSETKYWSPEHGWFVNVVKD